MKHLLLARMHNRQMLDQAVHLGAKTFFAQYLFDERQIYF